MIMGCQPKNHKILQKKIRRYPESIDVICFGIPYYKIINGFFICLKFMNEKDNFQIIFYTTIEKQNMFKNCLFSGYNIN